MKKYDVEDIISRVLNKVFPDDPTWDVETYNEYCSLIEETIALLRDANEAQPVLTENQQEWLENIYSSEASEFRCGADNLHLAALGSSTQEEAVQLEQYADEQREFAAILENMAKELNGV